MPTAPVLLLLLVLLVLPSAASAAVREAVPAGGADERGVRRRPRRARWQDAVAGAAADDTVRVASGTYDLATTLDVTAGGLTIEAASVEAPPLLQWSGSAGRRAP